MNAGVAGAARAKKAEGGPRAKNSFDQLGQSMVEIASDLPEDSSLGTCPHFKQPLG